MRLSSRDVEFQASEIPSSAATRLTICLQELPAPDPRIWAFGPMEGRSTIRRAIASQVTNSQGAVVPYK